MSRIRTSTPIALPTCAPDSASSCATVAPEAPDTSSSTLLPRAPRIANSSCSSTARRAWPYVAYCVTCSEACSAFSIPRVNAFTCGTAGEPTTAVGMDRGVGLAMAYVYEPAKRPAAAARMKTSTTAGKWGDSLKSAHFCATIRGPPCAPRRAASPGGPESPEGPWSSAIGTR